MISKCERGWRIWVIQVGECPGHPFLWLLGLEAEGVCTSATKRLRRVLVRDADALRTGASSLKGFKSRRLNLNGNVSAVVIYYPRDILWSRTGHVEGPAPREDPLPRVLPTEGQTEGFDGKVDHWGGR